MMMIPPTIYYGYLQDMLLARLSLEKLYIIFSIWYIIDIETFPDLCSTWLVFCGRLYFGSDCADGIDAIACRADQGIIESILRTISRLSCRFSHFEVLRRVDSEISFSFRNSQASPCYCLIWYVQNVFLTFLLSEFVSSNLQRCIAWSEKLSKIRCHLRIRSPGRNIKMYQDVLQRNSWKLACWRSIPTTR